MVTDVISSLAAAQNADGGWAPQPGGPSSTEATALALWALAAFRAREPELNAATGRGLGWLCARQRPDGSWPMNDQVPESNWMSTLAVLSLAQLESERERAVRGGAWLLAEKSRPMSWGARLYFWLYPEKWVAEQDMSLRGWSWAQGTTAWVEPTSLALVAIKQLAPFLPSQQVRDRIREGELVLRDRMCIGGGWNYGNKRVMGIAVPPYPDTTALALIALQDQPADEAVQASLTVLDDMLTDNRSGLVLALSTLCLQLYGRDVGALRAELLGRFRETRFDGSMRTTALALLALDEQARHFAVPSHG
jgi:hypothetical protein